MQFRSITAAEAKRFDDFVRGSADGHLFQSYSWGEIKKPEWTPLRVVLEERSSIVASAAILKRTVPPGRRSIFYLPRGPVLADWDDADVLERLFRALRDLAEEHRAFLIKIDPCLTEERTAALAALRRIGFKLAPGKDRFGGIQPRYTFRIDLGGDLDQIMARFPKKVRYKIRYGCRQGLTFASAGVEGLPQFVRLIEKTALRGGFVARKADYYRKLFQVLAPGGAIDLQLGSYKGEVIVAGITFAFGDKAWAVYGGQGERHRNLYAYNALIWERIKWAKSKGARWFDLYGVPGRVEQGDPLFGIYSFKKSFGGDFYAFIGEHDLPLSGGYYRLWSYLYPVLSRSAIQMIGWGRGAASALALLRETFFPSARGLD